LRTLSLFIGLQLAFMALAPTTGAAERGSDPGEAPFPLRGRHGISLCAGILNRITVQSEVVNGGVTSEARDSGVLASLSYAYWVTQEWSVGLSAGFIDAGTRSSVTPGEVTSGSAAVTSLLFGAAYYPMAFAITPSLRPYGSVAVGPYVGSATNSRVGTTVESESISESVVGLRVLVGADLFFAKRFKAGIAIGYDLVDDFDQQIGSHRNYSGPQFSAGCGILLGRGR
jgi:hypothetical protein